MSKEKLTVKKDQEFVAVRKSVFLDDTLSWTAKGIMAYLYCKPEGKTINLEQLVEDDKYNAFQIANAVQELIDKGMIQ